FCMTSGFCFLFVMAILASITSPHLIALFRDDPAVIEIGAVALRYQCFVYPLNAVIIIGNMLFQTTGMMFRASFMAVARQGLFFIPVVLILPLMLELQGIMMAQTVADVLAFLFSVPMILSFLKVLKKDKSEEIGK
ncbi:MAG: MATE family efflux transporter, partial [Clostridia bacterium]|nr:MATE family efflux transporter [Clostridia bacterium]